MWFVYSNDVVSGPFDTQKVQEQLSLGNFNASSFIWWKGQREWMPIQLWETQLKQILKNEGEKTQAPVWYLDTNGTPVGPLTQNEMLAHLRGLQNLGRVRLWTVGMNKWTNLFELHEIMDQLGMSRRENARAPLMGTVAVSRLSEDSQPILARAASISVAGIGINEAHGLTKGETVQLVLKSPEFPHPIRLQAMAVYVTPQGYAGLKFTAAHPETQSLLFDYVKRFSAIGESARKSA